MGGYPGKEIVSSLSYDKNERVMIVDDDLHILIAVKMVLNEAGFIVEIAESCDTSLNLMKAGFTGIILP